jgi:hypothetical protein
LGVDVLDAGERLDALRYGGPDADGRDGPFESLPDAELEARLK